MDHHFRNISLTIQFNYFIGQVSKLIEPCGEETALNALDEDPLGVVSHYAITKLHNIITTLMSGNSGVTVGTVFYVGKDAVLVDQWKALLRILNKGGVGDFFAQSGAALCLSLILVTACPSMQTAANKDEKVKTRTTPYASAVEPLSRSHHRMDC